MKKLENKENKEMTKLQKFISIILIILICLITPFLIKKNNTKQNNEIVFWTLQMGDFAPYMKKVINDFEAQNPNIKIKWIDVPFSEGEKRTLAAILSNTPPDLINLNPDFSALLAQKGALKEINEKELSQFNQELLESLKYNGKLYALPWYATSAITIYNKSLYKQAGYSRPPKTYERLGEIAENIKQNTGAYVFIPTITENNTMLKILNKYGVNS